MSQKAVAHRNALVALARFLAQHKQGAILAPPLQMVVKLLRGRGGLAYRVDGASLSLAADIELPVPAREKLTTIIPDASTGHAVSRAAAEGCLVVDDDLETQLPSLHRAGWTSLGAVPMFAGDTLLGVLAVGTTSAAAFDDDTRMLLEAVASMLALALAHEESRRQQRHRQVDDGKTAQLATLGLVADTVARDLASPLSALEAQLDRQHERIQGLRGHVDWQVGGDVAAVLDALEVASDDTTTLLRHAQAVAGRLLILGRETEHEAVDLGDVVRETAHLVASRFQDRRLGLSLQDLDDELTMIGRRESLQMMLVHLLVTFADVAFATWEEGPEVILRLDRGEEVLLVTFEARGSGPRLGLAEAEALLGAEGSRGLDLVERTMRTHEGHIELGAGEGGDEVPTLRLVFPAVVEQPRLSTLPTTRPHPTQSPSLLWIDEDVDYAQAICREIATHECFFAGSVAEALTMLMTMPSPDLVLCSVSLPDGSGTSIHADAPEALQERFVFATGALLPSEVARYLRRSDCSTLIKPVGLAEIRRLLDHQDATVARTLHHEEPADDDAPDIELDRLSDPDLFIHEVGALGPLDGDDLDWSTPDEGSAAVERSDRVPDDHDDPDEDEADDPGRVTMIEPLDHRVARQTTQRRQAPTPPQRRDD